MVGGRDSQHHETRSTLTAIHEDLAFTKRQSRQSAPTEDERLLFAKDPYVYFYEDFLKAYDKGHP